MTDLLAPAISFLIEYNNHAACLEGLDTLKNCRATANSSMELLETAPSWVDLGRNRGFLVIDPDLKNDPYSNMDLGFGGLFIGTSIAHLLFANGQSMILVDGETEEVSGHTEQFPTEEVGRYFGSYGLAVTEKYMFASQTIVHEAGHALCDAFTPRAGGAKEFNRTLMLDDAKKLSVDDLYKLLQLTLYSKSLLAEREIFRHEYSSEFIAFITDLIYYSENSLPIDDLSNFEVEDFFYKFQFWADDKLQSAVRHAFPNILKSIPIAVDMYSSENFQTCFLSETEQFDALYNRAIDRLVNSEEGTIVAGYFVYNDDRPAVNIAHYLPRSIYLEASSRTVFLGGTWPHNRLSAAKEETFVELWSDISHEVNGAHTLRYLMPELAEYVEKTIDIIEQLIEMDHFPERKPGESHPIFSLEESVYSIQTKPAGP